MCLCVFTSLAFLDSEARVLAVLCSLQVASEKNGIYGSMVSPRLKGVVLFPFAADY